MTKSTKYYVVSIISLVIFVLSIGVSITLASYGVAYYAVVPSVLCVISILLFIRLSDKADAEKSRERDELSHQQNIKSAQAGQQPSFMKLSDYYDSIQNDLQTSFDRIVIFHEELEDAKYSMNERDIKAMDEALYFCKDYEDVLRELMLDMSYFEEKLPDISNRIVEKL